MITPKTLQYQIKKAIHIADNNAGARVGVFADTEDVENILQSMYGHFFYRNPLEYFSLNMEGKVTFVHASYWKTRDDCGRYLSGTYFSHIFVTVEVPYKVREYLRTRIRSHEEFNERPGFYSPYGVERVEDY